VDQRENHATTNGIKSEGMKIIVDNKIMRELHLIMAAGTIAVSPLAGIAGAMQEYEDLKVLVA
jgi:hypothetical protein